MSSFLEPSRVHASSASREASPNAKDQLDLSVGCPHSRSVDSLFVDFYQLTMMYGYWKANKHNLPAAFDLFFRRCPFGGEFAVVAGVSEVLRFINTLRFTENQITYIREQMPGYIDTDGFFDYLRSVSGESLTLYAMEEGTLVFPREPVIRVEGPLAIAQVVETAIINLTNFPCLVATKAARLRLAAGWDTTLLEFGTRRAQGPNGALCASRYAYMGGFDATSSVRAGYVFGIPIRGTHAHSFITSFKDLSYVPDGPLPSSSRDFKQLVVEKREEYINMFSSPAESTLMNEGELAAFICYAQAFPDSFLCLVDTYDTVSSGVPNFIVVALALLECGYTPSGIRLDSGDLAYLSLSAREQLRHVDEVLGVSLSSCQIVASNDVNEAVLHSLNKQKHSIDAFGIGTQLVTCQAQPSLGMVYKLCEVNNEPCMKLSQELEKMSIPSRKAVYRLYGKAGEPVIDVVQGWTSPSPKCEQRIFCRHLFDDTKRCFVIPSKVDSLLKLVWSQGQRACLPKRLQEHRETCIAELRTFRQDHLRPVNPTPYKVSVSEEFYRFFHDLWQKTTPIHTIE